MINQLSATLLISDDPARLATFYEQAFGIKFRKEEHDDEAAHYGAFLGSIHIGIHPPANFPNGPHTGPGGVKLAFDTLDFDGLLQHLAHQGIPLLYPPVTNAWSKMTAVADPDGNFVELLQPCNEILQAAATRGRGLSTRVGQFIDDGKGFSYRRETGA